LLVLAAIAPGREGGRASSVRFLRSPWLAWLGTISYGIYLWHLVVLELISRQPHPRTLAAAILLWLAVLVGAVVLGAASWYLVERPLQRALRARENKPRGGGRAPEIDGGVQSLAEGLNPSGVAVDHLA
jgi:peptidoglycan/LPS O-acetylase OafA/YrhL